MINTLVWWLEVPDIIVVFFNATVLTQVTLQQYRLNVLAITLALTRWSISQLLYIVQLLPCVDWNHRRLYAFQLLLLISWLLLMLLLLLKLLSLTQGGNLIDGRSFLVSWVDLAVLIRSVRRVVFALYARQFLSIGWLLSRARWVARLLSWILFSSSSYISVWNVLFSSFEVVFLFHYVELFWLEVRDVLLVQ